MAKENFKEQLNYAKQLNEETRKQIEYEGLLDATLEDRVDTLNKIKKGSKDNTELSGIQRDIEQEIKKHVKSGHTALADKWKTELKLVKTKIQENKLHEKTIKSLKQTADTAKGILATVGLGAGLTGIFTKFAEITGVIGKEFGALGMTNKEFKSDMITAATEAASLGKSIEDVSATVKTLTTNFGFSRDEAAKMTVSVIDTSMALGLSVDEGAQLLGSLTQIAGMSFDTATNFAKQTALLADAEGVAPNVVMRDIANSSEAIAKFSGMTPEHIAKAAIHATKLGLSLTTIAGSMEGMLDFQGSLNAEIEASIMLGRNVNLLKARELALAGKADQFAVELTKQVGSQAEFEKMNLLQRQSLAKALGISVEQMAKMVNNQDKIKTLGDAISEQPGLEKMFARESLDAIAGITNDMKRIGMELVESIGPSVSFIVGGFAKFTQSLSKSKLLLPAIGALLAAMATKSLVVAYANLTAAMAQLSITTGGIGLLAIPAALGAAGVAIAAGVSRGASLQGGGITTQEGLVNVHPQEAIIPIEKLGGMVESAMKPVHQEISNLRKDMQGYFGFGGTASKQIGSQLGSRLEQLR